MATAETRRMVMAAAAACDEKKAEETRVLELDASDSGFTDFFLIASGTNTRQVVSISDEIEIRMKREFGTYPNSVEGRRLGEWVLMDYVDFVVHIFLAEKRAFYDIERLRKAATRVDIDDWAAALTEKVKAAKKKPAVKKAAAVKKSAMKKAVVKKLVPVKKTLKKAAKKAVR
jgi:ribosome-associated protein